MRCHLFGRLADDLHDAAHEVKGVVRVDEAESSLLDNDPVLPGRTLPGGGRGQDQSTFEDLLRGLAEDEARLGEGQAWVRCLGVFTLLTAEKVRRRVDDEHTGFIRYRVVREARPLACTAYEPTLLLGTAAVLNAKAPERTPGPSVGTNQSSLP